MTVVTCSTSHLLPCLARNGWETWGGTGSTRTDVKVRPRTTERFPRILVDRCSSRTTRETLCSNVKDIFKDGQYFSKTILIFTITNHHFFLRFLIFALLFKNLYFLFLFFFFSFFSLEILFYVITLFRDIVSRGYRL